MAIDQLALRNRARRAYERGRLRHALHSAGLVVPVLGLSLLSDCHHSAPALRVACAAILFVVVAALVWRGGPRQRAVWPGVLGGVAAVAVPQLVRAAGHACAGGSCRVLEAACLVGGVFGGILVGVESARGARGDQAAPISVVLAGLVGSLGCVLAGVGGLIGMTLGIVAGAAPAYWVAHPRRTGPR